ncbi:uncharacterized protein LOC122061037 [Macadamia integrifolia]|uniref:uncharacterized protein LOC122061037 n=1 Tax=Macadamia integrifolia TaxID=60698 RepID=UPI001C52A1AD|nr:uncharacterized protein LOC122061037 [Macadamia integrifolia]
MALISALCDILQRPTIGDVFMELVMFLGPLSIAFLIGLVIGWSWKPKWATLGGHKLDCSVLNPSSSLQSPSFLPGFISPPLFGFVSIPKSLNSLKPQLPSCNSWISDDGLEKETFSAPAAESPICSSLQLKSEKSVLVTGEDLEHLCQLVEVKDGGPAWIQMMDRSTPNMSYQAWRRDPETGPPQYRSRTVFEDATPELVRDFFWDDEFRMEWDDMLIHSTTLEECPTTGTMVVHWIRKFPFFCSDREYTIGRRIWESGRTYYCVTKGVPYASVPRRNKPRRVDLYYSSWCIRAVESKRGGGQLTACEVVLFHHEDMGIPWEIAKLGVRQGMWGAVKKIEPGLRAYQRRRASGAPISQCAFMAQINSKVNAEYLRSLETNNGSSEVENLNLSDEKPKGKGIPKLLVVGGAVILACSLDKGLLTKAVIFGVARRFANIGKIGRRL